MAEQNTFQGERCVHNALNDRIRKLLLHYDFSKTSDPHRYWSAHISGLLARATPPTSYATAGHRRFHLHKFLLAARTPYFRAELAADMLFLDGLKTKAAVAISTLGSASALVDRARARTDAEPVNIYDVIHAAWDLRVRRLEEFAARYLAGRLEDYIDDPDFHDLIRQSAARIRRREETDSIELLDDIRYYLSERFRLRFEDPRLEDMLTPDAEKHLELLEDHESVTGARPAKPHVGEAGQGRQQQEQHRGQERTPVDAGVVRAREGDTADDEFASDAINYDVLMGKIDSMLDSLKLDA